MPLGNASFTFSYTPSVGEPYLSATATDSAEGSHFVPMW
jgi:hypothetical protein